MQGKNGGAKSASSVTFTGNSKMTDQKSNQSSSSIQQVKISTNQTGSKSLVSVPSPGEKTDASQKALPTVAELKLLTARALTTINEDKDHEVTKLRAQLKKEKDEGKQIVLYQNLLLVFILLLIAAQIAFCYIAYKQKGNLLQWA